MVKVPKGYRSRNVNDRRGSGGRSSGRGFGFPSRSSSGGGGGLGGSMGGGGLGGALGGGRAGSPRRAGGCGGMGLILIVVLFAILFFSCQGAGNGGSTGNTGAADNGSTSNTAPANDSEAGQAEDLVNFILDDVQDNFWVDEYPRVLGEPYRNSKLNIFSNAVSTGGCGNASSNVGPFYCPADEQAYIDLEFMIRLQRQLGAGGDFSQAYILAHEVGHHVQNLAGINDQVRRAQSGATRAQSNALQVAMELQADCFAGAWAADADARGGILEAGDLEEGVRAAGAVGDDAITGSSNQENFTHGSSAQRIEWFSKGFDQGADSCLEAFG